MTTDTPRRVLHALANRPPVCFCWYCGSKLRARSKLRGGGYAYTTAFIDGAERVLHLDCAPGGTTESIWRDREHAMPLYPDDLEDPTHD